jgi:hypothetical protein
MNQCCCEQSFSLKLSIDTQFQLEHTTVPILGELSLKTQSQVTRSVTRLQGTTRDLNNSNDNDNSESDGDINSKNDGGSNNKNNDDSDCASPRAVPLKAAHRKPRLDCCTCLVEVKKLISNIVVSPKVPR